MREMTRPTIGRVPRWCRHLRQATVAALAAVAMLVATSGAPVSATQSIVVGLTLEPPHLDPTAGAAAAIDEVVFHNVFEGLTRIDETGTVQPWLAERWTVSSDGLEYRFTLRQGVQFHDGSVFDSADAAFSLNRGRAEDSVNAQKGFFEPIAAVETPEPHTLVVRLSRPDGLFLFHLGLGDMAMVGPESAATNRTAPVGTGPFRFVERVEGDRIVLERFASYWMADTPPLDRVVFQMISDPSTQIASLLSGAVDAFPNLNAPEGLVLFEADPRFEVFVGTTEGETILAFNQRQPPFDDPRVRRAIAHAIDRQALIDGAMFGYGTPIGSHFAPHHPAYVDLTHITPYDPERARSLLAEAGFADGFTTTLHLPPPSYARRSGEIIQSQLAAVGVTVELVPVEWAQWLDEVFAGFAFDMTIVSHTEPLDIAIYARGPDDYYFGHSDPEFDAIIVALETTLGDAERAELYGQAQALLADQLPAAFLFQLAKHGVAAAGWQGLWRDAPIQVNDMTAVQFNGGP